MYTLYVQHTLGINSPELARDDSEPFNLSHLDDPRTRKFLGKLCKSVDNLFHSLNRLYHNSIVNDVEMSQRAQEMLIERSLFLFGTYKTIVEALKFVLQHRILFSMVSDSELIEKQNIFTIEKSGYIGKYTDSTWINSLRTEWWRKSLKHEPKIESKAIIDEKHKELWTFLRCCLQCLSFTLQSVEKAALVIAKDTEFLAEMLGLLAVDVNCDGDIMQAALMREITKRDVVIDTGKGLYLFKSRIINYLSFLGFFLRSRT